MMHRNIAGWSAALTLIIFVVFAGYPFKQYDYYDRGFAVALYGAVYRPLWALAMAWIIFACHHGFGVCRPTVVSECRLGHVLIGSTVGVEHLALEASRISYSDSSNFCGHRWSFWEDAIVDAARKFTSKCTVFTSGEKRNKLE
ncbi:hypothetical protein B566_EDAN010036 [Ephemera danica]|nr:hypothetical protein B566_EDAN010036 [Ephemera danica]